MHDDKLRRARSPADLTNGRVFMAYSFINSVPYLINRAGVSVGNRFAQRIADRGISLPMYRALAVLRQTGTKTLGELSVMVSKEQSTLSRIVGQMEDLGLVTRVRPKENARIVLIDLTEDGARLAEELMPIAIHFEETLTHGLTEKEVQDLKRMLKQVYANIDNL